jgi:hypothetical protein
LLVNDVGKEHCTFYGWDICEAYVAKAKSPLFVLLKNAVYRQHLDWGDRSKWMLSAVEICLSEVQKDTQKWDTKLLNHCKRQFDLISLETMLPLSEVAECSSSTLVEAYLRQHFPCTTSLYFNDPHIDVITLLRPFYTTLPALFPNCPSYAARLQDWLGSEAEQTSHTMIQVLQPAAPTPITTTSLPLLVEGLAVPVTRIWQSEQAGTLPHGKCRLAFYQKKSAMEVQNSEKVQITMTQEQVKWSIPTALQRIGSLDVLCASSRTVPSECASLVSALHCTLVLIDDIDVLLSRFNLASSSIEVCITCNITWLPVHPQSGYVMQIVQLEQPSPSPSPMPMSLPLRSPPIECPVTIVVREAWERRIIRRCLFQIAACYRGPHWQGIESVESMTERGEESFLMFPQAIRRTLERLHISPGAKEGNVCDCAQIGATRRALEFVQLVLGIDGIHQCSRQKAKLSTSAMSSEDDDSEDPLDD